MLSCQLPSGEPKEWARKHCHDLTEKRPPEWILLCDQSVSTFAESLEVALQYACRRLIEEFHKALKSGLGAERLQLEAAHRLYAAIATMSIEALRLIDWRERVRLDPDAERALPLVIAHLMPAECRDRDYVDDRSLPGADVCCRTQVGRILALRSRAARPRHRAILHLV